MIWRWSRFFLFLLEPETAHKWALRIVRLLYKLSPKILEFFSGVPLSFEAPQRVAHLDFRHPLGLAAGFDKNAKWLPFLPYLGFSFAEIGTVTLKAQEGNPQPRLFRLSKMSALFNRMGFNNEGSELILQRLIKARSMLPKDFRVGVNIGKNKDTPLSEAWKEYAALASIFASHADFIVINVSSPNTPGLRELQDGSYLEKILFETLAALRAKSNAPLFLKLAPELEESELRDLVLMAEKQNLSGWVICNTLAFQWKGLSGGLSGEPLRAKARNSLKLLRALSTLPIISVGGVADSEDYGSRLLEGAQLVEIYTSYVYQGPRLLKKLLKL